MSFHILPKDPKFFELFAADGDNLAAAAAALHVMVDQYDDLDAHVAGIQALEKRGDEIDEEVTRRLEDAFITPFDREDIHELVSRLDDVVDGVQSIAEAFVIFGVTAPTDEARRLAAILDDQGVELAAALRKLNDLKDIERHLDADPRPREGGRRLVAGGPRPDVPRGLGPDRGHQVARPVQRLREHDRCRRGCRRGDGADVPQGQLTGRHRQVGRRNT